MQSAYRLLIKKITTISKTSSRKVLITNRIGTIASNFVFGAARAGGAGTGGFGIAGTCAAGAGGGAIFGACGIGGGAIAGIGGRGGAAKGAGPGAAACGVGGGSSTEGFDGTIREIIRVKSPGPEFKGAPGATGCAGMTGLGGVCASRWIIRVTPPGAASCGSRDEKGGALRIGSGR
jgi:hypothetical protein